MSQLNLRFKALGFFDSMHDKVWCFPFRNIQYMLASLQYIQYIQYIHYIQYIRVQYSTHTVHGYIQYIRTVHTVDTVYSSTWIESSVEHKFRAYVYSRRKYSRLQTATHIQYSTTVDIHTYRHTYSTYSTYSTCST